jgi:hypothetical protein
LKGPVRAEVRFEGEKVKAEWNQGAEREYGRILGQTPSNSVSIHFN